MLQADYVNDDPEIEVRHSRYIKKPTVFIRLGGFGITLDLKKAEYLLDELESEIVPFSKTRTGLEATIEELRETIQVLYERGRN